MLTLKAIPRLADEQKRDVLDFCRALSRALRNSDTPAETQVNDGTFTWELPTWAIPVLVLFGTRPASWEPKKAFVISWKGPTEGAHLNATSTDQIGQAVSLLRRLSHQSSRNEDGRVFL